MSHNQPSNDRHQQLFAELRTTLDKLHDHEIELARVLTIVERPARMIADNFSPPVMRVGVIKALRKCLRRCKDVGELLTAGHSQDRDRQLIATMQKVAYDINDALDDLELVHIRSGNEPELDGTDWQARPDDE